MAFVEPVTLRERGVRLEPLDASHEAGLRAAAADGELWKLRITSVPEPQDTRAYIEAALKMREDGNRFAFSVVEDATDIILNNYGQTASIPSALPASLGLSGNGRYLGPDFSRAYVYEAPGAGLPATPNVLIIPSGSSYLSILPGGANNDHRGAIAVHPKALFGGSSVAAASPKFAQKTGPSAPANAACSAASPMPPAASTGGRPFTITLRLATLAA